MAVYQIGDLSTIPQAPADADVLAIEVNGVTYKVSKSVLAAAILAQLGGDPVTVAHGGTGATTAAAARTNLSVPSTSEMEDAIQQSTAREIVTGSNIQSSVSIPNGEGTVCSTVSLTSGVWLVIGSGDWAVNDTGYRQIAFASGTNPDRRKAATTMGIAGKEAYVQVSQIIATTGETVSLYALQNSGAALNVYPFLYAVRLGNVG